MHRLGQNDECRLLVSDVPSGDTTLRTSRVQNLQGSALVTLQLITEPSKRFIAMTAGDTMTGASHILVAAKGAFTANDIGATVVITGSVSNNATFTVASVTNATTVVMAAGGANETFTGGEKVVLTPTNTLDGAWAILVSEDVGQTTPAGDEHWTDITATTVFAPAVVTVANGTAATRNQFTRSAPLGTRAVMVTFQPSAGHGRARALIGGGVY